MSSLRSGPRRGEIEDCPKGSEQAFADALREVLTDETI